MQHLAQSQNRRKVYFDPINSHAAIHFQETPGLQQVVAEALTKATLEGDWLELTTDMGRVIGMSDEVVTDKSDEIIYAKRRSRDAYTPFTKSQSSQPCSCVATVLRKLPSDSYELLSAWIGNTGSPPFPGEPNETTQSKPYWSSHALVYGHQEIQHGTETSLRPW